MSMWTSSSAKSHRVAEITRSCDVSPCVKSASLNWVFHPAASSKESASRMLDLVLSPGTTTNVSPGPGRKDNSQIPLKWDRINSGTHQASPILLGASGRQKEQGT